MRTYYVTSEETCEVCEGHGYVYNPIWQRANVAYDEALVAAKESGKSYPEDINAAGTALENFWMDHGYNHRHWPPEELPCPECEGEGKIVKSANLLDALRDLGVHGSFPVEEKE